MTHPTAVVDPINARREQFGSGTSNPNASDLPTTHGFDEFYGNLYHLNAEEEPERANYPPAKDFPEYRNRFGKQNRKPC